MTAAKTSTLLRLLQAATLTTDDECGDTDEEFGDADEEWGENPCYNKRHEYLSSLLSAIESEDY